LSEAGGVGLDDRLRRHRQACGSETAAQRSLEEHAAIDAVFESAARDQAVAILYQILHERYLPTLLESLLS
jgi:hypothetical protein